MKKITSIEELNNLIDLGIELIWFSKKFECGFRIKKFLKHTYSFNYIEIVFEGNDYIQKVKLEDIYYYYYKG